MKNIISKISNDLILRHFSNKDSLKIIKFHEDVLRETGAFSPGPWNDDMNNIEECYIKKGGCFVIIEKKGTIIAMGALKIIDKNEAEIKRMRVKSINQRQGLGQIILDFLISYAKKCNIKRLILDTTELQKPAQQFYKKNNFTEYGKKEWNNLKVILFEKFLS